MTPKYLPSSIDAISPPIDLERAINLTTGLPGPFDYTLLHHPKTGEIQFRINGKLLSQVEAAPLLQPRIEATRQAAGDVLEALKSGDLRAYVVRQNDSRVWQIPRYYYFQRASHDLALKPLAPWDPSSGEDESMIGQPVMLSEREFREWLSNNRSTPAPQPVPPASSPATGKYHASSPWEEIVAWYTARIAAAPPEGYKRAQDIAAGKLVGIARDRVRDLRRELKPDSWPEGGRPRKTKLGGDIN